MAELEKEVVVEEKVEEKKADKKPAKAKTNLVESSKKPQVNLKKFLGFLLAKFAKEQVLFLDSFCFLLLFCWVLTNY